MAERWRPVLGWVGLYEVSDDGRVRSVERDVAGRERSSRHIKGKILAPRIRSADGIWVVNLWNRGVYRQIPVRRLVLEAFDQPRPRGFDASNANGDLSDNRLTNLTWAPDKRLRNLTMTYDFIAAHMRR